MGPLYAMLDRVLEVGVNPDGFFYDIINPRTGEILKSRLTDTFAYNYNGYYAVYLADGHTPYRDAVRKVFDALPHYPAYNGGETVATRTLWKARSIITTASLGRPWPPGWTMPWSSCGASRKRHDQRELPGWKLRPHHPALRPVEDPGCHAPAVAR